MAQVARTSQLKMKWLYRAMRHSLQWRLHVKPQGAGSAATTTIARTGLP